MKHLNYTELDKGMFPYELRRIRWRVAMMQANRIDELLTIAKSVKFKESLTYDPTISPMDIK